MARSARALFVASLPERVLRSASALAGGLLRQIGDAALPAGIRRTKLYHALVAAALRFLIEEVGQVEGVYPGEERLASNFLARRTAGHGIELIGILTFQASPVWVLAALADLSGAGRQLIGEIADSLKREGLLEAGATFESVDQILDGLERTSGRLADAINTPPLDVAGLRAEWAAIRAHAATIPAPGLPRIQTLRGLWQELKAEAAAQNQAIFSLSSLMALDAMRDLPRRLTRLSRSAALAARRAGQLYGGALLEHYQATLGQVREKGFLAHWREQFRPYLAAAAKQFSPGRPSLTQRLFTRR